MNILYLTPASIIKNLQVKTRRTLLAISYCLYIMELNLASCYAKVDFDQRYILQNNLQIVRIDFIYSNMD